MIWWAIDTGGGSRIVPPAMASPSSARLYQLRLGDLVVVGAQLQVADRLGAEARASGSAASATAGCPGSGPGRRRSRPPRSPRGRPPARPTPPPPRSRPGSRPGVAGQAAFRASRQRSPGSVTRTIMAGSTRGNSSVPSTVQRRACPEDDRLAGLAAVGAEVVGVVEVGQRDGVGHQPGVAVAEQRAGLPERRAGRGLVASAVPPAPAPACLLIAAVRSGSGPSTPK